MQHLHVHTVDNDHYNRARPTLLIKWRQHHSYDTYDYDSTVFHNVGFTTPCIMDFSLTMIPVLNGPRAENHDTNFRENSAPAPTGLCHGFQSKCIPFWLFEVGLAPL